MPQQSLPLPGVGAAATVQPIPDQVGGGRPPHVVVCFGFGGKLLTAYPPRAFGRACIAHVYNVSQLLQSDPDVSRMAAFPGPLTRGSASTETVADFAARMATECAAEGETSGRKILWELLAMLVNSYGNLGAADTASDVSHLVELLQRNAPHVAMASSQLIAAQMSPDEMRQVMERLRQLVCAGKKQDALKHAIASKLWPHALVLAQQISQKALLDTTAAFAQSSLPEGDPTRTLYLLLAQQPSELFRGMAKLSGLCPPGTAVPLLDRWAENLAAIVANRGLVADRAVIGEIGDRLWSVRGAVAAAHFCYLVAAHTFGYVDNPNTRVVLLGADHKRRYHSFVTHEAIQATECYEFAKTAGNPQYTLPQFQPYKLIYAQLLADAGLLDAAQKYIAAISAITKAQRGYEFNPAFLAALSELEDRLKKRAAVSRTVSSSWTSVGSWLPTKKLSRLFGSGDRSVSVPPARAATPPVSTATSLPVPMSVTPPPLRTSALPPETPTAPATAQPTPQSAHTHTRSQSSGGGSWLSKILGRKTMILPEETNDIQWDEATRTWRITKDAPSAPSASPSAPPSAAAAISTPLAASAPLVQPTPATPLQAAPAPQAASSFMAMAVAASAHVQATTQQTPQATPKRRNPRYIDPMTQQVRTAEAQPVSQPLTPTSSIARPAAQRQFFVPTQAVTHDSTAPEAVPSYAPLAPSPRQTPQPATSPTPTPSEGVSATGTPDETTPATTPYSTSPDKPDLA